MKLSVIRFLYQFYNIEYWHNEIGIPKKELFLSYMDRDKDKLSEHFLSVYVKTGKFLYLNTFILIELWNSQNLNR